MAISSPTTSRRAMLAIIASSPVLAFSAGAAVSTPRDWTAALARYKAALSLYQHCSAQYETAEQRLWAVSKDNRLHSRRQLACDAADRSATAALRRLDQAYADLKATPAPDTAALAVKIEIAHAEEEDWRGFSDVVLADVRRIGGL